LQDTIKSLVEACRSCLGTDHAARDVRQVVADAIADHQGLVSELGQPARAGIQRLHVADDLTVLNVIWAPRMTLRPHNHNMWAVIGVYAGREDNIFWRRSEPQSAGIIEAAGARSLGPGDVFPLGSNIIHSVTNPTSGFTGAIHVYGGDFFTTERSEWDPAHLTEKPYNLEQNMKLFQESNAMWAESAAQKSQSN